MITFFCPETRTNATKEYFVRYLERNSSNCCMHIKGSEGCFYFTHFRKEYSKYIYIYVQGIHKRMLQFQKLTRNFFLTLHGHNVHRQQRQLSKFLMRYQQFASHTYCGASF